MLFPASTGHIIKGHIAYWYARRVIQCMYKQPGTGNLGYLLMF